MRFIWGTKIFFWDAKVILGDTKCFFRIQKNVLDIFGGQKGLTNCLIVLAIVESQKRQGWGYIEAKAATSTEKTKYNSTIQKEQQKQQKAQTSGAAQTAANCINKQRAPNSRKKLQKDQQKAARTIQTATKTAKTTTQTRRPRRRAFLRFLTTTTMTRIITSHAQTTADHAQATQQGKAVPHHMPTKTRAQQGPPETHTRDAQHPGPPPFPSKEGTSRARAWASCHTKSAASSLHLPPVSMASTTNRQRPDATSSGYFASLSRLACSSTIPSTSAGLSLASSRGMSVFPGFLERCILK